MEESKRLSVTLGDLSSKQLEYIARQQDIAFNEAIRRAIATEALLFEARARGADFYIKEQNGESTRILFR